MQKSVGQVYPAAMMAFNFMNTPVKSFIESRPDGGLLLGKPAFVPAAHSICALINRLKDAERGGLRFSARELWKDPMLPQNIAARSATHLYPQVVGTNVTYRSRGWRKRAKPCLRQVVPFSSSRKIDTHEHLFCSAPMPPLAQLGAEGKMRVAFIIPHR
jgi:hypothetical protein